MPPSYNICVLIDRTILSVHHGVRRYLMALCSILKEQGHSVQLINGIHNNRWQKVTLERRLLVDNGFSENRLVGNTRSELLDRVRSGREGISNQSVALDEISCQDVNKNSGKFDLCIVGAPWIKHLETNLPDAGRYVCIAYDAIPNIYYFTNPRDHGLHLFAYDHAQGYLWADQQADGIYCISDLTARQCKMLGFGKKNGLRVLPPMIPPGYRSLKESQINNRRGRVGLLAAPFDRRKGLLSLPSLVNAGNFDSLLIYGRPRCSHEDLVNFFDQLNIENVEWWCDVDFEKQVELYTRAKVLIFPSLNEGLGFPVLEAYACGTSVLTSNISPLNKLVLPEDLLASDETGRSIQIRDRVNQELNTMRYRTFVDELCNSDKLGLFPEVAQ